MPDSKIPDDLRYTTDHEWIRFESGRATVGITDHAQDALGEVTYVELPEAGTAIEQQRELAVVESLKAASDVYAPVGGTVTEANAALEDEPNTINADPYGAGWICKLDGVDESQLSYLLTADQYRELLASE
jgi:glycine cleavage system H protein